MAETYARNPDGSLKLDAAGNPILTSEKSYATAAKYTTGYNPMLASSSDMERQKKEAGITLGTQVGIEALGNVAQIALANKETTADLYNTAELKRLTGLEKAGKLGLSAGQRQQAEATVMNPVRAFATEGRQRGEAFLASGGGGDVASMERERLATKKATADAAVNAGIAISQADIEAEAAQRLEMEQRRAYASNREKQPFEMIGAALESMAPLLGKSIEGFATKREPYDAELLGYARERGPDGKYLRPGISTLNPEQLRTVWKAGGLFLAGHADTAGKLSAEAIQNNSVPAQ